MIAMLTNDQCHDNDVLLLPLLVEQRMTYGVQPTANGVIINWANVT